MKIIVRAALFVPLIVALGGCAAAAVAPHPPMFCVPAGAPTRDGVVRGLLCMPIDPEMELVPMHRGDNS